MRDMDTFIKEELSNTAPLDVPFSTGEAVIVVNPYGVVFQGFKVIGFGKDENRPNCHIYLNWDCWWCAPDDHRVFKANDLKPFLRAYSPKYGYLGIDKYKDFIWVNDPADAELFTTKAMGEEKSKGFIVDGKSVQCKLIPAEGCQAHS